VTDVADKLRRPSDVQRKALNLALDMINANAIELANRGFSAWAAANFDAARRIREMAGQ